MGRADSPPDPAPPPQGVAFEVAPPSFPEMLSKAAWPRPQDYARETATGKALEVAGRAAKVGGRGMGRGGASVGGGVGSWTRPPEVPSLWAVPVCGRGLGGDGRGRPSARPQEVMSPLPHVTGGPRDPDSRHWRRHRGGECVPAHFLSQSHCRPRPRLLFGSSDPTPDPRRPWMGGSWRSHGTGRTRWGCCAGGWGRGVRVRVRECHHR